MQQSRDVNRQIHCDLAYGVRNYDVKDTLLSSSKFSHALDNVYDVMDVCQTGRHFDLLQFYSQKVGKVYHMFMTSFSYFSQLSLAQPLAWEVVAGVIVGWQRTLKSNFNTSTSKMDFLSRIS